MSDKPAKIWDVPTRLFHWALVILFGVSWYTAENTIMDVHRWSGYAILGLVAFRIYWGFFGPSTARFGSFIKGPKAIAAYVGGLFSKAQGIVAGHNPLGALSVMALLIVLIVHIWFGLFAVDIDGIESGPLSYLLPFDEGRKAAAIHHLTFSVLLVLAALHILAIVFYLIVKHDNLIGPMITGRKKYPEGAEVSARFAPLWMILPGLIIAGALIYGVMKGFRF